MVTGEAAWEGYGRAPPAAGRRSWGGWGFGAAETLERE